MSRSIKLNEIIPGKLYQRGQFLTFPWSTKLQMLENHNIGMVVNLWVRPDPELHAKPGLIYLHWPIGGAAVPENDETITQFILDMMMSKTVLVHCEAGVNRSIWLAARLLAMKEEINGDEALEKVKTITRVNMRDSLVSDLESF